MLWHIRWISLCFLLAAICLGLIAIKLYLVKDGAFRIVLLWYFGTGAFFFSMCALWYHPFHDAYMVTILPHILALLKLCYFMIRRYGIGGRRIDD